MPMCAAWAMRFAQRSRSTDSCCGSPGSFGSALSIMMVSFSSPLRLDRRPRPCSLTRALVLRRLPEDAQQVHIDAVGQRQLLLSLECVERGAGEAAHHTVDGARLQSKIGEIDLRRPQR